MDDQDSEIQIKGTTKRRFINFFVLLLALLALVIMPLIMITGEFWGCHGDIRGEQHCHKLCLSEDQSHCAAPTELFGDYAPGHIH